MAINKIGKTLAWVALVGYLVAMALEAWRPGFVTFFWNPQLLLLAAVLGAVLGALGKPVVRSSEHTLASFFILAILAAVAVWQSFPPSGSRFIVTIATIILIAGAGFFSNFSNHRP